MHLKKQQQVNLTILVVCTMVFSLGDHLSTISANLQDDPASRAGNCIMVIGDSVAHGSAVFEVPGHGFPVLQTPPFSQFIDSALHDIGAFHLGIYDLSVEATSLTGNLPYTTTPEYRFALDQNCRFVVMFPWLNELRGMMSEDLVAPYMGLLAGFVNSFRQAHPSSTIVMLNYYATATSALGERIYENSITAETIERANRALMTQCEASGLLGSIGDVVCMDIASLFVGDDHVFVTLDRLTFQEFGYTTAREDDAGMLDLYWSENPDDLIYGDGVHLNELGKTMLADALIDQLLLLDATLFELNIAE